MKISRNTSAALLLFFLPCFSVEVLSGNMPLHMYFNPIMFIMMNLMYAGALLIRETVIRWNKGLVSVFLLGAAYGMVNEGIGSKGYFDPHFYAVVGFGLENFGRVFEINVPWAVDITIIHMVYSITVPIVIITVMFPGKERWLSDKSFFTLLSVFIFVTVFFTQMMSPYVAPLRPFALVIALILLLIIAAKVCPDFPAPKPIKYSGNTALLNSLPFLWGTAVAFAFIFVPALVRQWVPFPPLYVVVVIGFVFLFAWLFWRFSQMPGFSRIAFVSGILMPWIIHALTSGNSIILVAIVLMVFLIMVWRKSQTELARI